MTIQPGVLIDAAIPRTPRQRCELLVKTLEDYGSGLAAEECRKALELQLQDDEWWEVEDEILGHIAYALPGHLIITLDGGDVVIADMEEHYAE